MPEETNTAASCCHRGKGMGCRGTCGGLYGLGLIGALVYYLQNTDAFWIGVLGVLKAIVWPAFLVYELLKYLKM